MLEYNSAALGGLVVSVLATEPTGYSVAGSSPTEDGGILWVIKSRFTACLPNFLSRFSPVIFSFFATRWLWLLTQADTKIGVVAAG
jgi:hypothetical protein